MVYYVRFLKAPQLDSRSIRALITITTDLGDAFYPGNVTLHALVQDTNANVSSSWESDWHQFRWTAGNRNLWITIKNITPGARSNYRLVVSSAKATFGDIITLENMPEILGARCLTNEHLTERRYRTQAGYDQSIFEENGESIARHIWYVTDLNCSILPFTSPVTISYPTCRNALS